MIFISIEDVTICKVEILRSVTWRSSYLVLKWLPVHMQWHGWEAWLTIMWQPWDNDQSGSSGCLSLSCLLWKIWESSLGIIDEHAIPSHVMVPDVRVALFCHIKGTPGSYMFLVLSTLGVLWDLMNQFRWCLVWGWVGLWGFLWWAPSAKGKDHHGVSSGWSSVWHRSNTGLSSTQYEQIPIILGVWPFWLTPFYFRSITFWRAYG